MSLDTTFKFLPLDGVLCFRGNLKIFGAWVLVDFLALPIIAPDEPAKISRNHRPMRVAHEEFRTHGHPAIGCMTKVPEIDHGLGEIIFIYVVVCRFFILCRFFDLVFFLISKVAQI